MCAKNYQIWWRFDEVLTKTSLVIFWHTLHSSCYKAIVYCMASDWE